MEVPALLAIPHVTHARVAYVTVVSYQRQQKWLMEPFVPVERLRHGKNVLLATLVVELVLSVQTKRSAQAVKSQRRL